ncbi:MAG: OmpA family protein [Candidatus Omnitrophica bacterium]|nr:OmpA family protein [Candidatus Omnitrophota bacterium]
MRKAPAIFTLITLLIVLVMGASGCTVIFQKGRRKDVEQISRLQGDYNRLQDELSELERAKRELESRLSQEIDDKEVNIDMMERGLVITFVAEVLFDSGKAKLRTTALSKLDKVSRVLQTTVRNLNVGIEGHTDNVPIKHSGWKSNWELSSGRAMSVLHYLADEHGVDPVRLSATGYGEYRPIDSNSSPQGRQKNRRVEIVILPDTAKEDAIVQKENLK